MSDRSEHSWRLVPLGELLMDVRPGFASGEDVPDGVIQVRMNNITNDGTLDWTKVRRVPGSGRNMENLYVRPGDVLFNATNSPELVGKSALFSGFSEPVTFSNHFFRLRPEPEKADGGYLARWLTFEWGKGAFFRICRQWVNQASVPKDRLLGLPVPIPPLEEQRRIVAIVDHAEALRTKRRQALDWLDRLVHSMFYETFGDPLANPMGWLSISLEELVASGPQNGIYKHAANYGTGTPILRIDSFYDGRVTGMSELKRVRVSDQERATYRLFEDDIVINRVNSREYLGKCALIPALTEPTVFESNMMRFRLDAERACPRYVVEFLQTGFIKSQMLNSAKDAVNQSSINQQDIKALRLRCPPIELQREFRRRVVAVERLKERQSESLAELDALFCSLQQRAFGHDF